MAIKEKNTKKQMIIEPGSKAVIEWKTANKPVAYKSALTAMEERVEAIREGRESELVWFLEHPPLYTAGTSAAAEDLIEERFPVYKTGRGGQYTYHGPGQRTAYVMLNLKQRQQAPDIKKYIWQLEEWIIKGLEQFQVQGERRDGRVGIWVNTNEGEQKVAALGVRIRHWVSYHGIAINLNPDLSHYQGIVPCGISEYGVTSLERLGVNITMEELDEALRTQWCSVFEPAILSSAA